MLVSFLTCLQFWGVASVLQCVWTYWLIVVLSWCFSVGVWHGADPEDAAVESEWTVDWSEWVRLMNLLYCVVWNDETLLEWCLIVTKISDVCNWQPRVLFTCLFANWNVVSVFSVCSRNAIVWVVVVHVVRPTVSVNCLCLKYVVCSDVVIFATARQCAHLHDWLTRMLIALCVSVTGGILWNTNVFCDILLLVCRLWGACPCGFGRFCFLCWLEVSAQAVRGGYFVGDVLEDGRG